MKALTLTLAGAVATALSCAPAATGSKHRPPGKTHDTPADDVTDKAWVFVHDPVTDGAPTEIDLEPPTSDDGALTNASVNALNCLQEDGGDTVFGFARVCVQESSAKPDADGIYLSIRAPDAFTDPQDVFAQVQMYHHVNVVHDFYKDTFAFDGLDFPLDAVVNITINVQGNWQPFENAAFMPEAAFAQLGLPPRENGAIMFGQGGNVDYSYDASVIYHEYTHAMIGPDRMNTVTLKASGLDNTPGAMNEGLADYFASSILDDSFLGHYALGTDLGRDLASARKCPDDLTTEVHADGKIISTALWEVREALGRDVADGIVFRAVQSASGGTGLDELGALVSAEAASVGADTSAVVDPILEAHGLLGCVRAKPWVDVDFAQTAEAVPHQVEGMQSVQGGGFSEGIPGYHQFFVDVPAGKSVELSWTLADPQQQPFGGGAANGPLHLAVRTGDIVAVGGDGGITADTVVRDAPLSSSNAQAVTLTGACIPTNGGRVFALFLNTNANGEAVATMHQHIVDAPADGAFTATCE